MPEIIYLPKGSEPISEPSTVTIIVKSRGAIRHGLKHLEVLKMDFDHLLERCKADTNLQRIYVVGFHEAINHGKKRDQVLPYVAPFINK